MTADDVQNGRLIIDVGALTIPSEFLTLRFGTSNGNPALLSAPISISYNCSLKIIKQRSYVQDSYVWRIEGGRFRQRRSLFQTDSDYRKFGSITFIDLRDRYGITQLVLDETLTRLLKRRMQVVNG